MNRTITITLPVIDYPVKGYSPDDQRVRLCDELDKLHDEAGSNCMDTRRLLEAYINVGQAIVGMMRSKAKERLAGRQVDDVVCDVVSIANQLHAEKVTRDAEKYGWAILTRC